MYSFVEGMSSLIDRNDLEIFGCNVAEAALYYGIDQLRNEIWHGNDNVDLKIINLSSTTFAGLLAISYFSIQLYHTIKIYKTIPDNAWKIRRILTLALFCIMKYGAYAQVREKNMSEDFKEILLNFSFIYNASLIYNVGANFFSKIKKCAFSFRSNPLQASLAAGFHFVNLWSSRDFIMQTSFGDRAFMKNPRVSKIKILTDNRFYSLFHCRSFLNISSDIDQSILKRHFRRMSIEIHPDKNPMFPELAHDAFIMLNECKKKLLK